MNWHLSSLPPAALAVAFGLMFSHVAFGTGSAQRPHAAADANAQMAQQVLAESKAFSSGAELAANFDAFERVIAGSKAQSDVTGANYYLGYVAGIVDEHLGDDICLPQSILLKDVATIAGKYVQANPKNWILPPSVLVAGPIQHAYPCPK